MAPGRTSTRTPSGLNESAKAMTPPLDGVLTRVIVSATDMASAAIETTGDDRAAPAGAHLPRHASDVGLRESRSVRPATGASARHVR